MTDPEVVRLPDGRRAHLWQGGATSGPAVLFFHGCPDTRLAARPGHDAARRLGVRLVAVSRPGYGLSDSAASGHLSVADDTVAVADLLGIDRFAVLGMSVGGPYALACAAAHPDRVTAIGIVAAPALVPALDPPWPRDELSRGRAGVLHPAGAHAGRRVRRADAPGLRGVRRPGRPRRPGRRSTGRAAGSAGLPPHDAALVAALPDAEIAEQVRESVGRTDGYLRDAAVSFRDWEFDAGQVRCPAFLWYGDLDQQVSLRNARWLVEHLPDASLVVRERTGHLGTLLNHWEDVLTTLSRAAPAASR